MHYAYNVYTALWNSSITRRVAKIWITLDAKDMNHHRAVMIQHACFAGQFHMVARSSPARSPGLSAAMFALSPVILSTRQDIDTSGVRADSESDLQLAALATAGREEPAVVPSTPSSGTQRVCMKGAVKLARQDSELRPVRMVLAAQPQIRALVLSAAHVQALRPHAAPWPPRCSL
jgi:hypothetical protein